MMKNDISRRQWLTGTSVFGINAALCFPAYGQNSETRNGAGYRYQIQTTGVIYNGEGEDRRESNFEVKTELGYRERIVRSEGTRQAIRRYQNAETTMKFGAQKPRIIQLPENCREILAKTVSEDSQEIEFRCTSDQFTGEQQDLLRTPFNTFFFDQMANSLFGEKSELAKGQSVKVPEKIAAGLFGLGHLTSSDLKLTVHQCNSSQAIVKFSGDLVGRYLDSETKISAKGSLRAIFKDQSISQVRATFVEDREKGVIGPKFKGTTKLKLDPAAKQPELPVSLQTKILKTVSRPATLSFKSRTNPLDARHSYDWKIVYDRPGAVIWRWISDGEPIGQCSLVIPATKSVKKLTLESYADGVKSSLEENSGKIVSKKKYKRSDGAEILQVVVKGRESGISVRWHHCLITYDDGRRAEIVLTTEKAFSEFVKDQDLQLARSLRLHAQKMADLPSKKNR